MRAPYNGSALDYNNSTINRQYYDDTGVPVTEDSIRELTRGCSRGPKGRSEFRPKVVLLDEASTSSLKDWEASLSKDDVSIVDGVSAHFSTLWCFNVGHFMYDNVYPLWVTILRFGYLKEPVNILAYESVNATEDDVKDWQHWGLLKALSHTNRSGLTTTQLDTPLNRFQRLLVGSRWMGHRDQQRHMGMPGSYSYENAFYWYGQRILAGYGILDWNTALDMNTPIVVDDVNKRCKGVITDNKRFSDNERTMLKTLADESEQLFGCNITFLSWKDYTFEDQIRLFADTNIYISGVGTGLTRCHLIKPGGVIVQLGELDRIGKPERYQVSYRDVHMAIGSPHLNSVYYSRRLWNTFGRLVREGVVDAINRGISLARSGYPIPRPYNDGLSPTSQSYEDYCAASPDDCRALTDIRNGISPIDGKWSSSGMCEYCSWVDFFGRGPLWTGLGCMDKDQLVHCPLNRARWETLASPDEGIAFEPECYDKAKDHMMEVYNTTVHHTVEVERNRRLRITSRLPFLSIFDTALERNNEILNELLDIPLPDCPFVPPTEPHECAC
ncbi:hypothetical protein Pmar_PMAR015471 [Perkinsus marinus ATCC 50983]|uniref:Uncharacterized protein n=1 Tax=Perkinsus marinus (strain ATCC 50983 / TXsc) TaxID=423536 RepID=C5L8A2_PERM5|nr:hypothetical protein Pmar_PMAR015471 [Perkinsus marinus ATCC 50983]EER07058.1 hypothetical protein Pmar_PMAR015471 [Perkinsus marinus ATCC 50983]|eukprot:XP_002775242.1 hypothetical protein Pmar_PMAR015471 [Perkinsus marinus ATCC 50983]